MPPLLTLSLNRAKVLPGHTRFLYVPNDKASIKRMSEAVDEETVIAGNEARNISWTGC